MKTVALCCAALLGLQFHNAAYAIPTAYINSATGALYLSNDTGSPLATFSIFSPSGNLRNDPALYVKIPGTTYDLGDLPAAFSYFSFPHVGLFSPESFIGNVVVPGTPLSDLSGYYWPAFFDAPQRINFVLLPEPTSSALGVVGTLAFVSLSRRFRS